MSPEQQQAHRAKIGVRSSAILGQFWVEQGRDEAIETLEIEGWQDVLENCKHSEIRQAWAEYQKMGPRTKSGKLCKPDAGALYLIILRKRPKPVLVKEPELERGPRVSAERAKEIRIEFGFDRPDVVEASVKRPKPMQSRNQIQENINKAREV